MINLMPLTKRAQQALRLAEYEADQAFQEEIEPQYILLGLLREEGGIAGRLLQDSGLSPDAIRNLRTKPSKTSNKVGHRFSRTSKSIIEAAQAKALTLGHSYIGTEHLLWSLLDNQPWLFSRLRLDQVQLRGRLEYVLQTKIPIVELSGRLHFLKHLVSRLKKH